MKEEIISFKTAKLALEKNITFPSTISYTKDGDICNNESLLGKVVKKYPIISQSLLQRILRDEYLIDINIESNYNYTFSILKYEYYIVQEDCSSECEFNTYEEALEAALYETLELIEND